MTTHELTDLGDAIVANESDIPLAVNLGEGIVSENGVIKGFHIPEDEAWRLVPEFARDKDFPFFHTTAEYVIQCVQRYADIKAGHTDKPDQYDVWKKIASELHESELLMRILSGQEIFTLPPPRSFKSHWYELIENGEAIPAKVRFTNNPQYLTTGSVNLFKDDKYILIDEHQWDIIERLSDDKDDPLLIARYNTNSPDFLVRKATEEEIARLTHPRQIKEKDSYEYIVIRQDGQSNVEE